MAKRATPSKGKPAKKTSSAAKKKAPAKKAPAPAKKAVAAKGVGKKKAAPAARKPAAPAKKAAPVKKAAPAKKAAPVKKAAAAPARKAPPPKKAAPVKKPGRARRAAAAMKSAAKAVAAVVGAPVKAVAAVVVGPVVDVSPPPDSERHDDDERESSGNGAAAHAGDINADEDEGSGDPGEVEGASADPAALLDRIESAYRVRLPDRYRRFLENGEYRRYPRIELAGYIRGPYDLDFVDVLLPDVSELGQNAGIYDMDDVPWSDDYAGYVPLASLSHPEVDEPKVFLVHQVAGDSHRVLLFDYEGWRLYPLADSFESFLANLPRATNDISTAFRPGA